MKNLKKVIEDLYLDETLEANIATMKLEQKTRNKCKTAITEALLADIAETLAEIDMNFPVIARINKGIGLGIASKNFGNMPVFIEVTMKGLDFDISEAASAYKEHITEQAVKKAESAKAKYEKAQRDAEIRERKRAEREAKEAEKQRILKEKANV